MEYKRLVKKVMVNGQECIVCALYGTEQCRIHTEKQEGCATCPALAAIYNQLYEFEEAYTH